MVRERDFTRGGIDVPAEQPGVAGGVMRRAERPAGDQRLARREQTDDAMNLSGLQGLFQRQWWEDRGQPLREHGLAGARRTDEQATLDHITTSAIISL
jgi:hypothetical protein